MFLITTFVVMNNIMTSKSHNRITTVVVKGSHRR